VTSIHLCGPYHRKEICLNFTAACYLRVLQVERQTLGCVRGDRAPLSRGVKFGCGQLFCTIGMPVSIIFQWQQNYWWPALLHLICPVLSPPISLHYRISAKLGSKSCEGQLPVPFHPVMMLMGSQVLGLHFSLYRFLDLRVIFNFISICS